MVIKYLLCAMHSMKRCLIIFNLLKYFINTNPVVRHLGYFKIGSKSCRGTYIILYKFL